MVLGCATRYSAGTSFICWSRTRIAADVTPNSATRRSIRPSVLNSPSTEGSWEICNFNGWTLTDKREKSPRSSPNEFVADFSTFW
jgi:hypothetical protein